jgi:2,4-dienoyl-CoA reductase-like NADH-dependent reductase (Old Yellow Enzyme family)
VGSITLNQEFLTTAVRGVSAEVVGLGRLIDMLARGDFDLAAVGRALLVDPHWVEKVRRGALDELLPYTPEAMKTLS